MNNFFTEDTKAIILLCGVFGKDRSEKPLSLAEYSSLVRWLIGVKMRPGDLLQKENVTEASMGSGIDRQRLELLLGRGVQLGFAVEEWQRNGIWIISRSDTDYPTRYKKHLQDKAPPLLFGVGDRSLLNGGGLGIVGSRHVDHEGEVFTRQVAELCAYNRMPIVSGGARGVDQIAMTAALEAGGVTIGILAENLLKKKCRAQCSPCNYR
jgi:predicted Rossmann fold nucleotide-binding protein DprA/Smf involved in DNA uptake